MTTPKSPAGPVWKCTDCDTNNDVCTDEECIVCGRGRPVSRVRINLPAPPLPTHTEGPDMQLSTDSLTTADTLWQNLIEHQPGVAAALAMQLRALPEDWAPRVLGVARPHAALELPATADVPMEIAPYDAVDWEECPACAGLDQLCRYHEGYATGYEALNGPLTEASRVDPTVTVKDALQRLIDATEAGERGELAAVVDHLTSTETATDTTPQASVPLTAREFFAVVDLSRPYIPEVDDPEDDDSNEAHAGCIEPHVSADGYTACAGKLL